MLPSSNHPKSTVTSIPFSQALRIVRICTNPTKRDIKLEELKMSILERNYPLNTIEIAIEKAKKVPRSRAILKGKPKENEKIPVFALNYNPRLPCVQQNIAKHCTSIYGSPPLKLADFVNLNL